MISALCWIGKKPLDRSWSFGVWEEALRPELPHAIIEPQCEEEERLLCPDRDGLQFVVIITATGNEGRVREGGRERRKEEGGVWRHRLR